MTSLNAFYLFLVDFSLLVSATLTSTNIKCQMGTKGNCLLPVSVTDCAITRLLLLHECTDILQHTYTFFGDYVHC